MRNNIFEWGDMYFLQLLGTAMGTSAACMWATIYFAVHETQTLIPTYSTNLLVYLRFIDDIFGIWIPSANRRAWQKFQEDTNNFGILTWKFEELATSVNFLDLTISIEDSKIVTKTYQKSINLYQYIMPQSAHPPNMARGIVTSLLRIYHRQNTKIADYKTMAILLFHRWVARGWNRAVMKEYILTADKKVHLEHRQTPIARQPPTEPLTNKGRIFIHWEYHQCDIPKEKIWAIYNLHLKEDLETLLDIKQATVCYSRPKNVRD